MPPEPGSASGSPVNLSQRVALNTALLVGGRIAVAASGLVGTVVATRYLGRDDFGQLQTAVAFVALLSVFTDIGLWTVAAREIAKRPDEEQRILGATSAIGIALSVATIAVAVLGSLVFYGGSDTELVRSGILITLAGLLVSAPLGTSAAHLTAHQRAVPSAVGGLAAALGFVAVLGLVVAADLGFEGVAAAYAASVVLNAVPPVLATLRRVSLRPTSDRAFATRLLRQALPLGAILAITTIYFRVDIVLLSQLGTNRDVALYGLSYRVLEFLLIVPMFAMATLFPELARAAAGSERLLMLVQGALSAVVLITVPMACVLIGFAPEVVRLAGGEEFDPAAGVLRLLIVAVAFSFPATVFLNALVALGRQGILLPSIVAVLVTNVALNVALVGPFAAKGAALALVITEAAAVAAAWYLFGRVSRRPRLQRPARLLVAGIACGATVAVVRATQETPAVHPFAVLLLGSAAAVAVFVLTALAVRAVPVEVTSAVAQLRERRS